MGPSRCRPVRRSSSRATSTPDDEAPEGPFGDHTGYYNEVDTFPVLTISRITHRRDPIYHSTYTGRPPDEPAILGRGVERGVRAHAAQAVPGDRGLLPATPEGCSYRVAVVTMKKAYPGHAKRVMMGVWSFLRQFMYTKFVIVTDDDINARDWRDVIWAVSTRMDPARDVTLVENTPIDYLDFASPEPGLGSKMGLDATAKLPGETHREWGRPIHMSRRGEEQGWTPSGTNWGCDAAGVRSWRGRLRYSMAWRGPRQTAMRQRPRRGVGKTGAHLYNPAPFRLACRPGSIRSLRSQVRNHER